MYSTRGLLVTGQTALDSLLHGHTDTCKFLAYQLQSQPRQTCRNSNSPITPAYSLFHQTTAGYRGLLTSGQSLSNCPWPSLHCFGLSGRSPRPASSLRVYMRCAWSGSPCPSQAGGKHTSLAHAIVS
eukprot:10210-Chlamydomonas_euryale.AAC.6